MMTQKKVPMRTCIITREKLPKRELVRIVRTPDGQVIIDPTGKANGRGAYIKLDTLTIEKAKKNKALHKHLEIEIPDSIYEELKDMVKHE